MNQRYRENINALSIHGEKARAYDMTVNNYFASQSVIVTRTCFAFMFTNVGDVIAKVQGMVIFPSATPAAATGDSRSISGHSLDIYKGVINLSFANPTVGVTPNVEIVQLFYID